MKMAELQGRSQELTAATPAKPIVEEDAWQEEGACPWSQGPETSSKTKDSMDVRMERIE